MIEDTLVLQWCSVSNSSVLVIWFFCKQERSASDDIAGISFDDKMDYSWFRCTMPKLSGKESCTTPLGVGEMTAN